MKMNSLHKKAVDLVKVFLKAETELISVLQEIDQCRGYRALGFKSLFDYARSLGLSESVAYNLITISRKAVQVPALKEMIEARQISVSNAKVIASILTKENQSKWLEAAASLSKRTLEKEIAKEFPEKAVVETSRYVSENRLELKLGVSEALMEKLKRIQDLESRNGAASLEQALEAMADLYLQRLDPLNKISKQLAPGRVSKNPRYIPAHLKNQVIKQANAQCTHVSNGKRCSERRWIDIHHKQPLELGGKSTADNLTLLCKGHHQLLHEYCK